MGFVTKSWTVREDQELAISHLAGSFQVKTGKRLPMSRIVREALDAGLPLVRQRYDELARANVGKPREVTSLEARDA